MIELGAFIGLGSLVVAVMGYVVVLSRAVGKLEGKYQLIESIPEMKHQLDRLVFRQEMADAHAADILHSPDHRDRDELVRGMLAHTLRPEEMDQVAQLLRVAKTNSPTTEQRLAAVQLLGLVEWELSKEKTRQHA